MQPSKTLFVIFTFFSFPSTGFIYFHPPALQSVVRRGRFPVAPLVFYSEGFRDIYSSPSQRPFSFSWIPKMRGEVVGRRTICLICFLLPLSHLSFPL